MKNRYKATEQANLDTYYPLDNHVMVLSPNNAFYFFRNQREEIHGDFDDPQFFHWIHLKMKKNVRNVLKST